ALAVPHDRCDRVGLDDEVPRQSPCLLGGCFGRGLIGVPDSDQLSHNVLFSFCSDGNPAQFINPRPFLLHPRRVIPGGWKRHLQVCVRRPSGHTNRGIVPMTIGAALPPVATVIAPAPVSTLSPEISGTPRPGGGPGRAFLDTREQSFLYTK